MPTASPITSKLLSDSAAGIVYVPQNSANYLITAAKAYNLTAAPECAYTEELSLGVYNKANPLLWHILNKEVNHLNMAKIRSSINEDISTSTRGLSPQWWIYQYPLKALAALFGFMIIVAALLKYRFHLKSKQTAIIEHMAYTDPRYNLPNLTYFTKQAPILINGLEETFYIVKFAASSSGSNNVISSREVRDDQLKLMAQSITQSDDNILTTVADEGGSLVSLFKADSNSRAAQFAKDIVQDFGYITTNDSKILLHFRAGLSRVQGDILKSLEEAKIACSNAANGEILLFDSTLDRNVEFTRQVEACMNFGLSNNEFQAWYQNEYDLQTFKNVGSEAFLRWQSSSLGFLLPEKFIAIFERNGFILKTDYFIFEEACKLQRSRLDAHQPLLPISVNQSRLHLSEDRYVERIKSIFKKYKLPKNVLKLEFSSTSFENLSDKRELERVTSMFKALQKLGIQIVIDNFGSSYSSYKLLSLLPISAIKIDKAILQSTNSSAKMIHILESIITLGNKLNLRVVCEGIESKSQEALLRKIGCKFGQGFLNSQAAPLSKGGD